MSLVKYAAVVELADTRDLKSLGSNTVPVRVRPAAPWGACTFHLSLNDKSERRLTVGQTTLYRGCSVMVNTPHLGCGVAVRVRHLLPYGAIDKRLSHRPFTAGSRVQIPLASPKFDRVAQLEEHLTFNQVVESSSLSTITI